jgi:hypothetical protein
VPEREARPGRIPKRVFVPLPRWWSSEWRVLEGTSRPDERLEWAIRDTLLVVEHSACSVLIEAGRLHADIGHLSEGLQPSLATECVLWLPMLGLATVPRQTLFSDLVSNDGAVKGDVRSARVIQTASHALIAEKAANPIAVLVHVLSTAAFAAVHRGATDANEVILRVAF